MVFDGVRRALRDERILSRDTGYRVAGLMSSSLQDYHSTLLTDSTELSQHLDQKGREMITKYSELMTNGNSGKAKDVLNAVKTIYDIRSTQSDSDLKRAARATRLAQDAIARTSVYRYL